MYLLLADQEFNNYSVEFVSVEIYAVKIKNLRQNLTFFVCVVFLSQYKSNRYMWCVAHYHDAIMMVIKPQSKDIKPQDLLQITTLTESTARDIFSVHDQP